MYLEPPFDLSEATGTDREPALAEQIGHFVRAAREAFSGNTERAVKSDLAIWARWCAGRGKRALPAAPETVAAFVDAMAELRSPAKVSRWLPSIVPARATPPASGYCQSDTTFTLSPALHIWRVYNTMSSPMSCSEPSSNSIAFRLSWSTSGSTTKRDSF